MKAMLFRRDFQLILFSLLWDINSFFQIISQLNALRNKNIFPPIGWITAGTPELNKVDPSSFARSPYSLIDAP